ncbi:hypothetical protein [Nannocystis bainbridge]|uniref:Abortive infection protein-like C-terminal domain-containing protein n=1 Tax=Nannocystis bainbridge TaxID=2995303 RepID=A0ABT5DUR6_9BACT|nr:hypothetical protein [Nannocystis bainbridge]MDC0716146.1 hypothetical protein [Nannocystis bainbridge]
MALLDTLERKKARGLIVEPLSPFDLAARTAVVFSIRRAFKELELFQEYEDIVEDIRLDIVEHVFHGEHPPGPNIDKFRRQIEADRPPRGIANTLAYILDAKEDLAALDATAVVLRHMVRIVEDGRGSQALNERFATGISNVNGHLAERNIGYQFDGGELIRSSEPVLFKDVMEPCLHVLIRYEIFRDTEREFRKALNSWKKKDYKQAVHHSAEALEGMLRVLVKEILPAKHSASLQTNASVDILNQKKLWAPQHGEIMKKLHALRGDRGAHSEATKPEEGRATEKDAEATVYLSASLLVLIARAYEDHVWKGAAS